MTTDMRCLTNVMTEEFRSLSETEIDVVSGGYELRNLIMSSVFAGPRDLLPSNAAGINIDSQTEITHSA
jgi:hypothetical protein